MQESAEVLDQVRELAPLRGRCKLEVGGDMATQFHLLAVDVAVGTRKKQDGNGGPMATIFL